MVGGGRGDIEEVRLAGRRLRREGHSVVRFRRRAASDEPSDDPGFDWTGIPAVAHARKRSSRALTISSQFGVTAADGRAEPFGAAGRWSAERAEVEELYGPGQTLHLSLEEFARTLTSVQSLREGRREAGKLRPSPPIPPAEVREFHRLYRKHRALERPDLLALFPGFSYSRAFAAEFPESVQCGPLWPERSRAGPRAKRGSSRLTVLWYASPSSSDRIAEPVVEGLRRTGRPARLIVRSPRPMAVEGHGKLQVAIRPTMEPSAWGALASRADLALTTGTRSLLEAIQRGRPFLYFNGVLGDGRRTERHRPEKIDGFVRLARRAGVDAGICRAWTEFSRARNVARTVQRSIRGPGFVLSEPAVRRALRYPRGFEDAGGLIAKVARRFADPSTQVEPLLEALRRESRSGIATGLGIARSKV